MAQWRLEVRDRLGPRTGRRVRNRASGGPRERGRTGSLVGRDRRPRASPPGEGEGSPVARHHPVGNPQCPPEGVQRRSAQNFAKGRGEASLGRVGKAADRRGRGGRRGDEVRTRSLRGYDSEEEQEPGGSTVGFPVVSRPPPAPEKAPPPPAPTTAAGRIPSCRDPSRRPCGPPGMRGRGVARRMTRRGGKSR